ELQHWNGSSWTTSTLPLYALSLWADSSDDAWLDSGDRVLQWNGSAWMDVTPTGMPSFGPIGGSGRGDVWVADVEAMHHFDGASWRDFPLTLATSHIRALYAANPSEAWAISQGPDGPMANSVVVHWNGTNWSAIEETATVNLLIGITGSGPDDVW